MIESVKLHSYLVHLGLILCKLSNIWVHVWLIKG